MEDPRITAAKIAASVDLLKIHMEQVNRTRSAYTWAIEDVAGSGFRVMYEEVTRVVNDIDRVDK